MRHWMISCTLLLAFAAQDQLPSAVTVLDKYIEATGGKAAYDKINNRVVKSTVEIPAQGIKASMTFYAAKPNKLASVVEADMFGKIEEGCDGKVAWSNSMMTGPKILNGARAAARIRDLAFDRLIYWKSVFESAECVGAETIDGAACYKVVLTPKSVAPDKQEKPQTYYFDQKTGLLVKSEMILESEMGDIPTEAYPSDYKKVDGILISHQLRMMTMGMERLVTTESVEHNVELPADRFKLPADIQALVDKEKAAEGESKDS